MSRGSLDALPIDLVQDIFDIIHHECNNADQARTLQLALIAHRYSEPARRSALVVAYADCRRGLRGLNALFRAHPALISAPRKLVVSLVEEEYELAREAYKEAWMAERRAEGLSEDRNAEGSDYDSNAYLQYLKRDSVTPEDQRELVTLFHELCERLGSSVKVCVLSVSTSDLQLIARPVVARVCTGEVFVHPEYCYSWDKEIEAFDAAQQLMRTLSIIAGSSTKLRLAIYNDERFQISTDAAARLVMPHLPLVTEVDFENFTDLGFEINLLNCCPRLKSLRTSTLR